MNEASIAKLMSALAPIVHDHVASEIAKATRPLLDLITALEARVSAAETRGLDYAGTFQRAAAYRRGHVVTDAGSAWVALKDTEGERPGTGESWQLMVKSR